jgi:putative FmdB family regulatory protein
LPIFAYECTACGHTFDALQKIDAEALSACPSCNARALRKLLSAPNFHLKGKGWRKTDADQKSQKPARRPRFAHTFDSPVPHGDHHDHGHSHDHAHGAKDTGSHDRSHGAKDTGGPGHDHSPGSKNTDGHKH